MAVNGNGQITWKRRPSEIRGYERAIYANLDNGDYVRADYNISEKNVRLYIEVAEDKGASYYAVINKGRVTIEKNSNGRSTRVAERLSEKADIFSYLPNKDVIKLINNNYGIKAASGYGKNDQKSRLEIERDEVKKKYFRPEDNPYSDSEMYNQKAGGKFGLVDFIDIITGILVSVFFFFIGRYDFLTAGAAAVIWGILLGIFDIIFREREPVFVKIFFFLITGSGVFLYSYIYL